MVTELHNQGWYDPTLPTPGQASWQNARQASRGELRIIDFQTQMLMQGRGYTIVAGTVATGVAMDSVITDTDAEMCFDAALGTTIIPIRFGISFDDIATALTVKVRVKAVGTASNAGTAFEPIPLLQGGVAANCTARVQETGAVQVVAEVATQTTPLTATRVLFAYANVNTETPASATAPAALAGPLATIAASAGEPPH